MPNIGIYINYRPLRIGYCLRQNDLDNLRQVGIINTYLSGGILNPIIVISDEDDQEQVKNKILSIRPDILFTFEDSLKTKLELFERDYLPPPFQIRDNIIYEESGIHSFQVLDIGPIIRNVWEAYMKVSKKKYSNCVLPKWDKNDSLSLLFSLMLGSFDLPYKFKTNYEELYLKGLKAKPLTIEKNSILPDDIFKKVTPMLFTAHDLTTHYAIGYRDKGFIVGKHDNFNDLVSYWNFRATNRDAFFLPIDCPDRFEKCISTIKEILSAIGESNSTSKFHNCLLYYSKENEDTAKKIQEQYFSGSELFCMEYRESPYEAKYNLSYFDRQATQGNLDKSGEHFAINFQLPDFKYADEERYSPKKSFVASFTILTEFEYPQHTLQLPNFCDLNEWYARKVYFQYDRFRVEPEGFGIIVEDNKDFMALRPIYLPDFLKKIFERSKINVSPSESGKIARQIIEQMGRIEGCRVFKITGVRHLLSSITPWNEKTRIQCCEIIRDRSNGTFPQFEDLYIESRTEQKLTPEMVFDFLVKKKVFRPGVTIKCNKCDLKSWISIKSFSESIECPLCGNYFPLLIENPRGVIWHFRRSGLFGEENEQEGAIPVLLSLLQLVRVKQEVFTFTNYNLAFNNSQCEVDLIALSVNQHYYDKTPEIVIGECKSPGLREKENSQTILDNTKKKYQISDKDIENMVKVKEFLDDSGFRSYLLFSTTAKKFSEDEIKRFKALDKQRVPLILFTANELEPYFPYERYKREMLPQRHAVSFEDLTQNSRFIYLEEHPLSLLK